VVAGEELPALRLRAHRRQELARHVVPQQPFLVLGERRGVERRVIDVQVQEPLEEQVVLQLLAEAARARHREERPEQLCLEQVLRRDRRPAHPGVHGGEDR
jgi:hypothetical protein